MGCYIEYDIASVSLAVCLLTVCDQNNNGRKVPISYNSDEAKSHALTL